MKKIKLLTIYPLDPFGEKIGGIETGIRDLITYGRKNFEFELVGIIKMNSKLKLREWQNVVIDGEKIRFFPILSVKNLNAKTFIPLIFKFVFALFFYRHKINFKNRVIIFHRIEPAFVLTNIREKKILFIHGDIRNFGERSTENKWSKIRWLYYFLENFYIRQMKIIFVVSKKGCEYYKNKYRKLKSRFKFFPTWYDSSIFYKNYNIKKAELFFRYKIPIRKPIILFVGRLELSKGPLILIDSFFFIKNSYPNAQLLIAGDGTLKNKMVERVNFLSLEQHVVFLGTLFKHELAAIMNIADVLLLTSRFEGMPRVVLESLACGLPVVTTNVGEVYLVVKNGKTGRIVYSWDPKKIAKAAIEIIGKPPSVNICMDLVSRYEKSKILLKFFKEIEKIL